MPLQTILCIASVLLCLLMTCFNLALEERVNKLHMAVQIITNFLRESGIEVTSNQKGGDN